MTIQEHLEAIPEGWRLMALAQHLDGTFYCCLRTTDPAGIGSRSACGSTADEALHDAIAQVPSDD